MLYFVVGSYNLKIALSNFYVYAIRWFLGRLSTMLLCNFFATQKTYLFFVFFISLFLCGCSSMYMPNVPNASMLSKKGELHAGAHVSLSGNASVNTAYAVNNHFGLMLNASSMYKNKHKKDFRQNLIEIGAGYFTTFGPDNSRILEIFAGVGNGSTQRNFREYKNDVLLSAVNEDFNFNKSFFQVNYTSKKKKGLKLFGKNYPVNYGTVLRVSYLAIERFSKNGILQPTEDNIFLEPVFFTRLKLNKVFQMQYTSGSNFGLRSRKFLTAGNTVFTIGLAINIGNLY